MILPSHFRRFEGMHRLVYLFCAIWAFGLQGQERRDSLAEIGRLILDSPEYAIRDSANRLFTQKLKDYLRSEQGYADDLDNCSHMMALQAKDQRFRIFTWQMPDAQFHYRRYGLVAARTRRGVVITELNDQLENLAELRFRTFGPEEWPGAIYYKLLPEGQNGNRYTLLGLAMGSEINRKIVEVIEVRNTGKIRFGAKMFRIQDFLDQTYRQPPMRLVLPYNAKYSVTVNWHSGEDKVIMDHLAPPDPKMKGLYQTYGPDFSYDALVWEDGWWHLQENVRFNSGQERAIRPPTKPLDLPQR